METLNGPISTEERKQSRSGRSHSQILSTSRPDDIQAPETALRHGNGAQGNYKTGRTESAPKKVSLGYEHQRAKVMPSVNAVQRCFKKEICLDRVELTRMQPCFEIHPLTDLNWDTKGAPGWICYPFVPKTQESKGWIESPAPRGVRLGGTAPSASSWGQDQRSLSTSTYGPWRQQPKQGDAGAIKCPTTAEKGKPYLVVNDTKEYLKMHRNWKKDYHKPKIQEGTRA